MNDDLNSMDSIFKIIFIWRKTPQCKKYYSIKAHTGRKIMQINGSSQGTDTGDSYFIYSRDIYSKVDLGCASLLVGGFSLLTLEALWKDEMNCTQKIIVSVVGGAAVGMGSIGAIVNRCIYSYCGEEAHYQRLSNFNPQDRV
jgi:hypothetical protein